MSTDNNTVSGTIDPLKATPHNDDAERAVLAAMLLDEDAAIEAQAVVSAEDFYRPSHRIMFEAMRDLSERKIPVDQISLADHLASNNNLEAIGGKAYIIEVGSNASALANWEHHASIVARTALLRRLISASAHIAALAYDAPDDSQEVVAEAERLVLDVTEKHISDDFRDLSDLLAESFDQLEELSREGRSIRGITTGFTELDRTLSGMRGGDLLILAARPGLGKTSLALNIAINAAKDGVPVALFSLEMPAIQVAQRILCAEAHVDMQHINNGRMNENDWSSIIQASTVLDKLDFSIDDSSSLSMAELRAKVRRRFRGKKNGLVVVDYLQLMETPGSQYKDRHLEVAAFSRGLKTLAKEMNVPVLALSQLNRSVESRGSKRPQLSDLRESGSIEQDADVVMFIDRSTSTAEAEEEGRPNEGEAVLIIAKHRNGPTGDIPLVWQSRFTKFMNPYLGPAEESDFDSYSGEQMQQEF